MARSRTRIEVNTDAVTEGAHYIANFDLVDASSIARRIVDDIVEAEFRTAMEVANYDEGFPYEFQAHLMNAVQDLHKTVIADEGGLYVSFDLGDLGDQDDLEKAYHQGAKLDDNSQHWGPYDGEELKNEDSAERHAYFEAVRRGQTSVQLFSAKHGRVVKVPVPEGAWERTKDSYIEIWGDKAPEWLFIQYGQEEWAPYIGEYDLVSNISYRIRDELSRLLQLEMDYRVATANTFETTGIDVGFTKRGQPRLRGHQTIEIGGKTYRGGQFLPKA